MRAGRDSSGRLRLLIPALAGAACLIAVVVSAGGPPESFQNQWVGDVIQQAKERGIDRRDLGKELLLSIATEIGTWKVLAVLFLFLLASVGGTIFGVVKILRRRA